MALPGVFSCVSLDYRIDSVFLALLPRQASMTPAIKRVAMARAVQIPLEAVAHDIDITETRFFQCVRRSG